MRDVIAGSTARKESGALQGHVSTELAEQHVYSEQLERQTGKAVCSEQNVHDSMDSPAGYLASSSEPPTRSDVPFRLFVKEEERKIQPKY